MPAVLYGKAQIPRGSSRHVSTRHDTFDASSPCIIALSSLSNSTARHACHDNLDWLDTLVSTRSTRRTCRNVTWRAKWNLGVTGPLLQKTLFAVSSQRWPETIASTRCTCPLRDGQAECAWMAWMNTGTIEPPKVTNPVPTGLGVANYKMSLYNSSQYTCSFRLVFWLDIWSLYYFSFSCPKNLEHQLPPSDRYSKSLSCF